MTEMAIRVKSSQNLTRLRGNSGQAAIEYVLILVITVSLVLALIYQVFKPFQAFVQDYMGSYVECLLETGELPALGYDEAAINDEESCNAKFDPATLADGRPPIGGENGSSTTPPSNSSSPSSSRSSSSSSGGTYAGSSSRGGGRYFSRSRAATPGVSESQAGGGKVVEIAIDSSGGGFFKSNSTNTSYAIPAQKKRAVAITGLTEAEKKKLEKKAEGKGSSIVVSEGVGNEPKKIAVKKPEPKAELKDDDESFTIGNFIRILFIAAIVIALVIFVGGQALQMSKGFEK